MHFLGRYPGSFDLSNDNGMISTLVLAVGPALNDSQSFFNHGIAVLVYVPALVGGAVSADHCEMLRKSGLCFAKNMD